MKTLLASSLFLLAAANLPASVVYQFAINTSSLNGQSGYLDFDLAPESVPAPLVNAVVAGFSTDAVFNPANIVLTSPPDVTGDLSSSLIFDNATNFNDAFQPVTFGNFVDFMVTLSGPGIDTPASDGTTFFFSLYDSTGLMPLLTDSPGGDLAGVTVDSNSGFAPYVNPPTPGGISAAAISAVPEPAAYSLISIGLVTAGLIRRFRRS